MQHREQRGYVFRRGAWWYLRFRETINRGGELVVRQPAVKLVSYGPHYKTKASVKELAAEKLKEINEHNRAPETVVTLGDFAEQIYFPYVTQHKRPSTQKSYCDIWTVHCKARMA